LTRSLIARSIFQPAPGRNADDQFGKNGNINVVVDKPLRILGLAEVLGQPELLYRGQ
jgi:hypothetical protein